MADKSTTNQYGEEFKKDAEISSNAFIGAAQQMTQAANEMTAAFAGSRARVGEMMTAVSDAAPRMKRLGATFQDTTNAMVAIADATKRQTLASADSVAKLYATTKVIGSDIGSIVNKFTDVGFQF